MAHTIESIQSWIDNYVFTNNATASKDIMKHIVGNLTDHGYKFGPTENNGYYLSISGPEVNHNFIIKPDD